MNITKNDLLRVAAYAVGGSLLAGIYETIHIFTENQVPILHFQTDAVQEDQGLFQELYIISKRAKTVDNIAFIRMVDMIDRIVFLRQQLQKKVMIPLPSDSDEAHVFWTWMHLDMARLLTSIEASIAPDLIVEFQRHLVKISAYTETHLSTIMRLCV